MKKKPDPQGAARQLVDFVQRRMKQDEVKKKLDEAKRARLSHG